MKDFPKVFHSESVAAVCLRSFCRCFTAVKLFSSFIIPRLAMRCFQRLVIELLG